MGSLGDCVGSVTIQGAKVQMIRGQRDAAPVAFVRDAINKRYTAELLRYADAAVALAAEQPCLLSGCSCMEDQRP